MEVFAYRSSALPKLLHWQQSEVDPFSPIRQGVGEATMGASEEAVVRRFYEEMNNGRKNELAAELFTADHILHDPQVPAKPGPQGVADVVAVYQQGVEGHWQIEEIFSTGDRVVVRWTGSGTHVAEVNGIPPTGKPIRVDAISVHRMVDGKIAETWEVWDTLGFLQQIGVVPQG
jgi:steroid delta-isomerase-like uncharacterized protein